MSTKDKIEQELESLERTIQGKEPDPEKITRGLAAREKRRREALKNKITICLDLDIIQRFKELNNGERGYQSLINQALREWLTVHDVKELLKTELHDVVRKMDRAVNALEGSKRKLNSNHPE